MSNFSTKIINSFYKNCHIFSQKALNFPTKIVKFSYTNHQIFLQKLSSFPEKNHQIFLQIPSNFSVKIINFPYKKVKIFLQKSSNFPAKLDRLSCKKHQIFLQISLHFYTKIVKFSTKIINSSYKHCHIFSPPYVFILKGKLVPISACTFLWLKLSEQHSLSYLPHIFENWYFCPSIRIYTQRIECTCSPWVNVTQWLCGVTCLCDCCSKWQLIYFLRFHSVFHLFIYSPPLRSLWNFHHIFWSV